MKEIKISQLMDNYTDNEFFIDEESEVNMDRIKENVIENVSGKKTKIKPAAKIMIAIAAAAALAVGATAAAAAISGRFSDASGATYDYEVHEDGYSIRVAPGNYEDMLTLEDGRLIFRLGDNTTDVTDLMDSKTPYIYAYNNADTGRESYIVLGGTPEEYSIVDFSYLDGIGWSGNGCMDGIEGDSITVSVEENIASIVFNKSFVRENGEIHQVEGGWPYHSHSVIWFDGKVTDSNIPENWNGECMDAWLISAMASLDMIDPAYLP